MNLCSFRRFHCDPCSAEPGGDAALDTQGRTVIAGTCSNGNSDASGRDVTQIFVARLQPDSPDTADTIFMNGFDPPRPPCGP